MRPPTNRTTATVLILNGALARSTSDSVALLEGVWLRHMARQPLDLRSIASLTFLDHFHPL